MKNNDFPIDIVITWVDGSDKKWNEQRNKFVPKKERNDFSTGGDERYDDKGLLKYVLRSIEKHIPWFNKIYFVTCGQVPDWLNEQNEKIVLVNHTDFIPSKYLPTFNSDPIALNFHRIPGLSEHFIYVNDDMLFLKSTSSSVFFKSGLPCDMFVQDILETYCYQDNYYYTVLNDLCLLNHLCKKKTFIKKYFFKYYSPKYGFKNLIKNFFLSRFSLYTGIVEPHTPVGYLKSTYSFVWSKFETELDNVCYQKVRTPKGNTENIFRYYQMGSGKFYPINREKIGIYTKMSNKNLVKLIENQSYNMICINYFDNSSFSNVKNSLEKLFPEKSSFEK